jgi:hypothetical protein
VQILHPITIDFCPERVADALTVERSPDMAAQGASYPKIKFVINNI